MIKLFYTPGTCSLAAMAALEASGISYEPIKVDLMGDRADLRAVYPIAKVPAVISGDDTVAETIAIMLWAHHYKPDAMLLPTENMAMIETLSLMSWLTSTVHILRRQFTRPMAFTPDPSTFEALISSAKPKYAAALMQLEERLNAFDEIPLGLKCYLLLFHQWALADKVTQEPLAALTKAANEVSMIPGVTNAIALHRPK